MGTGGKSDIPAGTNVSPITKYAVNIILKNFKQPLDIFVTCTYIITMYNLFYYTSFNTYSTCNAVLYGIRINALG